MVEEEVNVIEPAQPMPPALGMLDVGGEEIVIDATALREEILTDATKQNEDEVVIEVAHHDLVDAGVQACTDAMDRGAQTRESGAIKHKFSIHDIKDDPDAIKYYTSFVSYDHFRYVLHCLGPAAYELDYKSRALDTEDELFMFMMKLRQNTEDEDLAYRFGISKSVVGKIFHTWLDFAYFQLKDTVVKFIPMETITQHMPKDFKKKFPTTRVILDATEIEIGTVHKFSSCMYFAIVCIERG